MGGTLTLTSSAQCDERSTRHGFDDRAVRTLLCNGHDRVRGQDRPRWAQRLAGRDTDARVSGDVAELAGPAGRTEKRNTFSGTMR